MSTASLEALAKAIHDDYVRREQREATSAEIDPALWPWESLPEPLKQSNRDQARDIEAKLDALNCEVVALGEDGTSSFEFDPPEVELLARMEHARWMDERVRDGWTPGLERDVSAKRTPYLVSWEELSEHGRDLDREAVRGIPSILAEVGFGIVRRA
jgi:hypothetical protein